MRYDITKRLTAKGRKIRFIGFSQRMVGQAFIADLYYKLSVYEDLEEDLGVSLITLSKAIHNGVWAKNSRQGIHFISHITWLCEVSEIKQPDGTTKLTPFYGFNVWKGNDQDEDDTMYRIEDYGKTWALTREELE